MCFKVKIQEDPEGEFAINVPPRPVSRHSRTVALPVGVSRRSSQRIVVEERSPHASGQLRRNISVSERSPRTSTRRISVSERSPRTSRNRLSASQIAIVQPRSSYTSNSLLAPNYIEVPRAEPIQIPAFQEEPTFVETREPPPEAPEPPRAARSMRSDSVHGERRRSRSRTYSSSRQGDFLTPQQSPRAPSQSPRSSGALMERQASSSRRRAESTSRHERGGSTDRRRSKYAEDAERLSREPSQSRTRESNLYLEDGRQYDGSRFVEEKIIQGDRQTTKQYYYV